VVAAGGQCGEPLMALQLLAAVVEWCAAKARAPRATSIMWGRRRAGRCAA
jgi:hypothetical protein